MKVEVYSRKGDKEAGIPDCVQCKMTIGRLEAEGIPHTVIDVDATEGAMEKLRALGVRQAPAVFVNDSLTHVEGKPWVGFMPGHIALLKKEIEAEKLLAAAAAAETEEPEADEPESASKGEDEPGL